MKNFILTGLMLLLSVTANAQVYKWVDENGKTQYTDRPPPPETSKAGQRLNIKQAASANTHNETAKSKSVADERAEFDKRQQQRKENEAKQQAKTEEDKKKCVDAQTRLRMYTDLPRMTVPDGSGGITYVDDDTRQQRINEANKAVKAFCK